MVVSFTHSEVAELAIPISLSSYVSVSESEVTVVGDRTGYFNIFMYADDEWVAISTDLTELLSAMRARPVDIRLDPFGVSAILHNGFVPLPHTVYRAVSHISMGDTVVISASEGRLTVASTNVYPWSLELATGEETADPDVLLNLLTKSTISQLGSVQGNRLLMMSSGKDSASVALALANAGLGDVTCLTYRSGTDDPEPSVAASVAQRLGLRHQIVGLPTSSTRVAEAMTNFFASAPTPGADLSQIPYVLTLDAFDAPAGAAIDGGGNDSYMGYPPGSSDVTKLRYRIRGRRLAETVRSTVDVDSPFNYLARSRLEATIPGRYLRSHHIALLYADSVDVSRWWYDQSREARGMSRYEVSAELERYMGPTQILMKHHLAAGALGLSSGMPWCDDDIADYYFNLPQREKFDEKTATNKLLLRSMLAKHLDYDSKVIGKHYFSFDGARFIAENERFVRSEIGDCSLWSDEGLSMVQRWMDEVPNRPLLYHAILTVFMMSGWHNHNQYAGGSGT